MPNFLIFLGVEIHEMPLFGADRVADVMLMMLRLLIVQFEQLIKIHI